MSDSPLPEKGSFESAMAWLKTEGADEAAIEAFKALVRDLYNFQATGTRPTVMKSVALAGGQTLRLFASLGAKP